MTHTFAGLLAELAAEGVDVSRAVNAAEAMDAQGVGLIWNPRMRTRAGCAVFRRVHHSPLFPPSMWIELNPRLRDEGPAAVYNTLTHEMAHILVGPHESGHGCRWRATARALGCTGDRCHAYPVLKAAGMPRRTVAVCETCAMELKRARKLAEGRTFRHVGCGGVFRRTA